MSVYTSINTQSLSKYDQVDWLLHNDAQLSLDSPAFQAMHCFNVIPAQVIEGSINLNEAALILDKTHIRTSFVIDQQSLIQGMISRARLSSRHILKIATKLRLKRHELTVSQVMITLPQLHSISSHIVTQLQIGDILKTMESAGHEYLLVIDEENGQLCGYFDLINLSKMIKRPLNQAKQANTFSEIVDSLWHHTEI
ncbi:hypothetical protein J8L98_22795 [Pseudoalteromonas sp. MMG013]|uniref:hypothetical protein n=1 Tax=Pseudoalteromonas sp. MMG013 TaxID=2822687 RepID=UPI001B35E296|nr:hypothetical protein [Pseudoalteromonas sp. MMG013]MBQ4864517.1 hypothetical protein [Pseudoalteromonas sp. MMG013]